MPRAVVDFGREITAVFGFQRLRHITSMPGSANVLWRLETGDGAFVVKELPAEHSDAYQAAAEFEHAVWDAGIVEMAELCHTTFGGLLHHTEGTRGHPVAVRVHRLVRGSAIPVPIAPGTLTAAGEVLGRLHRYGTQRPNLLPAKQSWSRPDKELYDRLRTEQDVTEAWEALRRTAELAADRPHRNRIPAHCDFKPANCLLEADQLIVLDWDEAGGCDPRLDAVASALSWARPTSAVPSAEAFAIFAAAYRRIVGDFDPVEPTDFLAALVAQASWSEFMAKSARRDEAVQALQGLMEMLDRLPEWCASINAQLAKE